MEEEVRHVQSLLDSSEELKLKDPQRSLVFALQALDWLPETGYEKMRVFANLRAANSEKIASHKEAALQYVNEAATISASIQDSNLMMRSAFMKATIFGFYDDADSALVYYQRTINYYKPGYDVFYAANAYTNIGGLFRNMGEEEKAETYFLKGYAISRGDNYAWIFTLSRLISFYTSQQNPKYLSYLDTFYISDFAKSASKATVAAHFYTFLNLSDATLEEKEKKLTEIYQFSKQQGSATHQVEFGLKLNALLAEQNKHEASKTLLYELMNIAGEANNGRLEAEVNHALYENAKALGENVKALTFLERASEISDSLHVADQQKQIQELNVRFEVAQKDHEIERQQLNLEQAGRNRNFLILIIALLGSMITVAILYFKNRIRSARRLREQEEIIHQRDKEKLIHEKEVVQLTASLESQEKERNRIARDLHDSLGSTMSGISSQIEYLRAQPNVDELSRHHLVQLRDLVKDATAELRRTSYELMPANLLRQGLEPAIQDLCVNLLAKNGIHPTLEIPSPLDALNPDQQLTLYRIIQELLNNIVKHAKAKEVLIQLTHFEDQVTLIIEDDGVGFDVAARMKDGGLGLGSLRSRVDLLKGTLDIASGKGEGTTVTVSFGKKNDFN
jgi:signal transduction histidine kinase